MALVFASLRRLPVAVTGAADHDIGMSSNAAAITSFSTVTLRVLDGGARRAREQQHRAALREIVGGCPDHWWKPTARRTAACTCDPRAD